MEFLTKLGKIMQFITDSLCPICQEERSFSFHTDAWMCRESSTIDCKYSRCVTRERALAKVLNSFWSPEELRRLRIHEAAPAPRGISKWLRENVPDYIATGYFPNNVFGESVNGVRNENLESQTFDDCTFDLVIHLDVMEHLFDPFGALQEIWRTLRSPGYCIFTAPIEFGRAISEQVAFKRGAGLEIKGEPEYHGNPQRPDDAALVTWRYGYDFAFKISEMTEFDIEIRRYQTRKFAIMGHMTEVVILEKS